MEATALKQFPCPQCGAKVEYQPGTAVQKCPFCSAEIKIPQAEEEIQDLDYETYLTQLSGQEEQHEQLTVKCHGCGAATTLAPDVVADKCPFCGVPVVAEQASKKAIKPKSLLPFKITGDGARAGFQKWVRGLWFAPSDLMKEALSPSGLQGLYVPYWTYDCHTTTFYRGERGDDYQETETYTTVENGRSVTRTRTVTKTRWTSVSGTVWNSFKDLLILASRSLPAEKAVKLEPWDLSQLVPYQDEYLGGFRSESYQVTLPEGFAQAQTLMEPAIREAIEEDIGGDHQRISSFKTRYEDIKFRHLLLPVWMFAYRFKGRVFHVLVNARTGEIQGERPWSWVKILLTVLGGLAAVAAVVLLVMHHAK